jgi:endonuclease YncB( thermonuclease family)
VIDFSKRRRRRFYQRSLWSTLLLLLALSAYQLHEHGRLTWHVQALNEIQDRIAAVAPAGSGKISQPPAGERLYGRVVRVTDGDTLTLRTSLSEKHIIRLHGIDAPERDQNHGAAALRHLWRLVYGRQVAVVIEDHDDYGRLVGTVYLEGQDVNLAMVSGGHAWWYRQYAKARTDLAGAEAAARGSGTGLWSGGNAVPPWTWRRRN